jgi:hypothetical protein
MESIIRGLGDYLDGDMLERNIRNAQRGYNEVEVISWD